MSRRRKKQPPKERRKLAPEVKKSEEAFARQVRLVVNEQVWWDFRAIAARNGKSAGKLLGEIVREVVEGRAHFDPIELE